MRVDIYSDNICPWCFIGKRHFDRAVRELGLEDVQVRWRPYQLYPRIPSAGVPRREFMRARLGDASTLNYFGLIPGCHRVEMLSLYGK